MSRGRAQGHRYRRHPDDCYRANIVDLAAVATEHQLGLALDDALRRRLTTLEALDKALASLGSRGRRGTAALRRLLDARDERDARTESRLEAALLSVLRASAIPLPAPQYVVSEGDAAVARLDFAYPHLRIGIEADGYRWHGGKERWRRDLRRENRLKLLGWTLLRFTWQDLQEHPEVVAAQIRAVLDRASMSRIGEGR